MNIGTIAKIGAGGATVGLAKGLIDQHNASNFDPNASKEPLSYVKNGLLSAASFGLMSVGGYTGYKVLKGTDFKKVAEQIAGSDLRKNILPSKSDFLEEFTDSVNKDTKYKAKYFQKDIDNIINDSINTVLETNDEISNKFVNKLHGSDYSEKAFESTENIMKKEGISKNVFDKMVTYAKKDVNDYLSGNYIEKIEGLSLKNIPAYTKTYFTNPDKTVAKQRIGAVAGTYGALALGGRYLSGGTLTRDNYGQADIAGVPFI